MISESSSSYISYVVTFLGSHEYQLIEVSTLLRHTADPVAADLIQSLISLVSTLSTKPVYWESIQPSVRETLVVSEIIFIAIFIKSKGIYFVRVSETQ